VYIHALVRNADRQKMSKTKGNTIDPLVVTEEYGTDAVRMALLTAAAPGTDPCVELDVVLRGARRLPDTSVPLPSGRHIGERPGDDPVMRSTPHCAGFCYLYRTVSTN